MAGPRARIATALARETGIRPPRRLGEAGSVRAANAREPEESVLGALAPGGVAVLTAGAAHRALSFYNVERSVEEHQAFFPGCFATPPLPFRDKLLFTVRAPEAPANPGPRPRL